MGNELIRAESSGGQRSIDASMDVSLDAGLSLVPWLDAQSANLVRTLAHELWVHHREVVALILFGSIARHDERSLDDSEPSDIDLVLLVEDRLPEQKSLSIIHTIGATSHALGYAPREIQPLLVERSLAGWDPLFVENVARDGILLWARGPLPEPLAPIAERARQ